MMTRAKIFLGGICITALLAAAADTRLAEAAMQGDRTAVASLLKAKADVNAAQGDGMTALHWSAYRDDLGMAQSLLRAGASVKATTRDGGITPLLLACTNGSAPMIGALLAAGADVNAAKADGTTPLMMAAASGSVDAVTLLLDHGADANAIETGRGETALMFAAALDRAAAIQTLLAHHADPNVESAVILVQKTRYGQDGEPISVEKAPAPGRGDAPAAESLAPPAAARGGRGAGRNKPLAMGGMTALLFAAREGHIAAAKALIDGGADINRVSGDKSTPLVIAIVNGHYDLAAYLAGHGADVNLANDHGLAPLYATIDVQYAPLGWAPNPITGQEKVGYLDLMKALFDRGANPNARLAEKLWFRPLTHDVGWVDPVGATAFWRAAQSTDVAAMKLLLAHGADPKIATQNGDTPLMVATGIGWGANFTLSPPDSWMPAVEYLVDLGADINAQDKKGYTALGGAAFRGNNEMVKYLLSKGARIDVVAKDGNTIADMANGIAEHAIPHPDTVALLEKLGSANSHNCRSNECLVSAVGK